eukprot:716110_1
MDFDFGTFQWFNLTFQRNQSASGSYGQIVFNYLPDVLIGEHLDLEYTETFNMDTISLLTGTNMVDDYAVFWILWRSVQDEFGQEISTPTFNMGFGDDINRFGDILTLEGGDRLYVGETFAAGLADIQVRDGIFEFDTYECVVDVMITIHQNAFVVG